MGIIVRINQSNTSHTSDNGNLSFLGIDQVLGSVNRKYNFHCGLISKFVDEETNAVKPTRLVRVRQLGLERPWGGLS